MNATTKQLALIKNIENWMNVKFEGVTISEATEFITKHVENYVEARKEAEERRFIAMYEAESYGDR